MKKLVWVGWAVVLRDKKENFLSFRCHNNISTHAEIYDTEEKEKKRALKKFGEKAIKVIISEA